LTIDHWPLTINHWPLTIDHWPLTIDHWHTQWQEGLGSSDSIM
jgi:hypothetical protein